MKVKNGEATLLALLTLRGAVPTSPYLAQLMSFSPRNMRALHYDGDGLMKGEGDSGYDDEENPAVLAVLSYALHPAINIEISCLLSMFQSAVVNGIYDRLFKREDMEGLVDNIKEGQGWYRLPQVTKQTDQATWEALAGLEERWVKISDGEVEEVWDGDGGTEGEQEREREKEIEKEHRRIVYNLNDVDSSLNFPDPTDARRVRYIDEKM